jgi:DHA1 family multidrug resistance protein-like MFS transporter
VSVGLAPAAPNWRRTLALMVSMQAAMAGSFSMSLPFMPFFLIQLGVAPTERVLLWAGLIGSVQAFTVALVSPFWGALADRHGRKAMVQRCCITTTLFYGLVAFCHNEWQVFAVQAVAGLFGGFSAAAMTLVGTQAPEGRLGFALGWMATGQLVGSLAGPLIGGALADHVHDYRLVFVCTALGSLAAALVVTTLVREDFVRPALSARDRTPLREQIGEVVRHPTLLPLVFVLLLAQMTAQAANPAIPLFVRSMVGDVPWLATAAGATIAIVGVGGMIASPFLGRHGDRVGYRTILIVSLIGTALFTFPQAFAPNLWSLVAMRFGLGLFLGGILPSANALIGRVFPRERRGRIYGITSSASYLGLASGPTLGGLVAAHFGFAAVFLVVGTLILINLACVILSGTGNRATALSDAT